MMYRSICFLLVAALLSFNACRPVSLKTNGPGEDSLSFIVLGDWGVGGLPAQKEVAEQMHLAALKHNVQFIITTGDNFYNVGVQSVDDPQWRTSFEDVYYKSGHQIPWFATLGNHDYNGSPAAEIAYMERSTRWRMPSTYYHFRRAVGRAQVSFVFADMNPFIPSYYKLDMPELKVQDTAAQYAWLADRLSQPAEWKILIGHQPLYSVGSHGSNAELIRRFKPLLLQTGTQFYLAGHDHNLQHIKWPEDPVHYLVSGGGGRALYPIKERGASTRFAESSFGFLMMTLFEDKARMTFINEKGEELHVQEVKR